MARDEVRNDGSDHLVFSRREVLAGAALGAAAVALSGASTADAVATITETHSINDIEHVVILMQENRSFDHYFGTLSGVRGYSDPNALVRADGTSVFQMPDVDLVENPSLRPYVLPWRMNSKTTSAQNAEDLSHAWIVQHLSWNGGAMDGFVTIHRIVDDFGADLIALTPPVTNYGPLTMGYFTRDDIPFQYALADAFTIGDGYHCSVLSETDPNRVTFWSGTIDPDGSLGGGPVVDNSSPNGSLQWESYPERLQRAGIDWYLYQESDNYGDNMLPLFAAFQDPSTDLYRRGRSNVPTPKGQLPGPALVQKLKEDVQSGNLPQVSWIVHGGINSEHPPNAPSYGANFISGIIDALTSDPAVWAKTVFFINYDENDGFFDHVVPPTAPPGTPGEYLSFASNVKEISPLSASGDPGPIGLGFRVPLFVISPFSRGGLCCSDTFDHTSVLRFLERRFGVEVPYLSDWRRETVGDLTSAFNFAAPIDLSVPTFPNTGDLALGAAWQQEHLPAPLMPEIQSMPTQEPGPPRKRPSGPV
jgi:phospholipase C